MHLKSIKVFVTVLAIMGMFINFAVSSNILMAEGIMQDENQNAEQDIRPDENDQFQGRETVEPGKSGTTLSTRVSAEASFIQFVKYNWGITKTVKESSAALALGNAADFHYTVTVTRTPAGTNLQAAVSGVVEVTNGGDRPTENLTVKVQLLYKAGKDKYQPLTELQVVATDMLQSRQTKAYTYSIPFTPMENASYKVQTYTTIVNHSGHIGSEYGPRTAADFLFPTQPIQRAEDKTAIVNDEMITPEGFSILSTGIFPWIVDEANLVVGEDGLGSAEQNYTVTVRNNSAQTNTAFALNNTATLKESSSNEKHEASQTVTINTENNAKGEGGAVNSEISASGFWNRKLVYDWAITKTAEPTSLSLAPGSFGTVNYILNAKKILAEDSVEASGVAGMLTVKNTGNAATQNLQINIRVRAKNGTEYQDIAGATQVITPAQQLAAGEAGNYNYNINFNPVPGAEYKVVVRITITNYAGQQGIPYETSSEQQFTLPVAPEETRRDNIAVVNDVIPPLQGFTMTGGLAGPWKITEAELAADENKSSVTKNYSVTIINNSAEVHSIFELNNIATLTENDSKAAREAQAQVIIVTPEEQLTDPGESTDSGDSTKTDEPGGKSTGPSNNNVTEHSQATTESNKLSNLPAEPINSANEFELPYEGITPPQDEAPMIPTNMFNLPVPNETLVNNERALSNKVTNSLTQRELMLPYTGGDTGLFVTLGMILVLYGNSLRRKQK